MTPCSQIATDRYKKELKTQYRFEFSSQKTLKKDKKDKIEAVKL